MSKELTDRQVEIIEVSGKILMEKGILGLTTKNLAKEMNFSESALYRHFQDKEAIITHLINYLSENITMRFGIILKTDVNAEEKLVAIFKSQFSYFKVNPHFLIIILSDGLMDSSENIKASILKLIQTNASTFKNIVVQGQRENVFNQEIEAAYLVHFLMGTFRLQMLQWKLANFGFDIEEKGMQTMSNLIQLLKTKS